MSEELFDKASADAMLPRLRELVTAVRALADPDTVARARRRLGEIGRSNGSADHKVGVLAQVGVLQKLIEEVEATGVLLRDLDSGLCDFPAVRDGAEIYLCWRLEEDEVGWWHPRDVGFQGRERL